MITQWVPLYESTSEAVKSEIATFFEVFPDGTVWSNDIDGRGYDVVLLGRKNQQKIDLRQLQQRLDREDHREVWNSLDEVELGTAIALLSTYAGQAADLKPWLKGAEINRDRNLRLQYLAGFGLNVYEEDQIYRSMLNFRRYPDELFDAPGLPGEILKSLLNQPGPDP